MANTVSKGKRVADYRIACEKARQLGRDRGLAGLPILPEPPFVTDRYRGNGQDRSLSGAYRNGYEEVTPYIPQPPPHLGSSPTPATLVQACYFPDTGHLRLTWSVGGDYEVTSWCDTE